MIRFLSVALALFLLSGVLLAQSQDRVDVFVGYSYVNNDFSLTSQQGLQGWNTAATARIVPYLGLTADFSGFCPNANVFIRTANFLPTAPGDALRSRSVWGGHRPLQRLP
jgi:hypothetical protein